MNIRTCRSCGRMFNYIGSNVCPSCRAKAEEDFQIVKKYVREHSGCSAAEVAEQCEIDLKQIKQWIREERLEFSNAAASGLTCEKCGALIKSGRFCESCKKSAADSIQNVVDAAKPKIEEPVVKKTEHKKESMNFRRQ